MSERERYNNIVIGAGSAGLVSAYISAAIKARVALIERGRMGGDCLNYGCVPSKTLIRTARMVHDMQRHQELGIKSVQFEVDLGQIMDRVQAKIQQIEPNDSVERYTGLGVDCLTGNAEILDPHTVRVGDETLTTKNIILAVGASPWIPPIRGIEQVRYRTSENLWDMRELPRRFVVLGGGPIGCEMAQSFARLGSQVTQIEMAPRILGREDEDMARLVVDRLNSDGVRILTQTKATEVITEDGGHVLRCDGPDGEVRVPFDEILVAVGRKANTVGVDWAKLGIELNQNGSFKVDEYLRTTQSNIYACGDCVGPYQLTHAASHQAWYSAVNALFSPFKKFKVDYQHLSWCTFTDPELAHVGFNEETAKAAGLSYEVTYYDMADSDRAIAESEDYGRIKVLTRAGSDKIIGATIVSHLAGELINEFVQAIKHGIGLNQILGTIHAYPTYMEANKAVAGVWKKAHAPQWALRLLAQFHRWRR
jgi:pyruvate/2-oxoglutarate dehydrogenase complex dihydrolipoamide dehydrogenase (E3) component